MATLATVNNSSKPGKLVLLWMAVIAWMPVHILAVLMDQTMNTPFHPWKMLYHRLQGSSTSGKPVLPWRQVNTSGGCTRPLDPKLGVILVFDFLDFPFLGMLVIDNNSQHGRRVYKRSIQQTQKHISHGKHVNLLIILIINHLYRLTEAEWQPQNVAARLLIYAPAPSVSYAFRPRALALVPSSLPSHSPQ